SSIIILIVGIDKNERVAILNTAGPFHTSKLSECSEKLKEVYVRLSKKQLKTVESVCMQYGIKLFD
ncbi:MAG: hypothetical protein J6W63_12155, partial [Treponema sp.]|nr:hypothetical protein [Treponema sp.]